MDLLCRVFVAWQAGGQGASGGGHSAERRKLMRLMSVMDGRGKPGQDAYFWNPQFHNSMAFMWLMPALSIGDGPSASHERQSTRFEGTA